MSDCKDCQVKLQVAENFIKEMGEGAYIVYQSRIPSSSLMDKASVYLIGGAIAIAIVIILSFSKSEKVEQPSIFNNQTQIEL